MNCTDKRKMHLQWLVLSTTAVLVMGCGYTTTLPSFNRKPVADAGTDRTVEPGQRVILDAHGSIDEDDDALTFSWQQRSGPTVSLDGAYTATPSFVPVEEGICEFSLTVVDGRGGSDTSTVRVFVGSGASPACPWADAGIDREVKEGASVQLSGNNSADPAGGALTYEWYQLSGPQVSIHGVFVVESSFTAPQVEFESLELEFELTVTNELGCSDTDTVIIHVINRDAGDPCDGVVCPDDDVFCNGTEGCVNGICVSSGNPCQPDEICDETAGSCEEQLECTDDSDCEDGLFCDGQEACVEGSCTEGLDPCIDGEVCNEDFDECLTLECASDFDCDDGVFCNGEEFCNEGVCESGEVPCLASEVCDEAIEDCIQTTNGPGTISSSEWREDAIDPVVDMDTYTFTAVAGEQVFIQVNRTSGSLNPRFDLYAPSGEVEAFAGTSTWHNHAIAALTAHTLAESGLYSIVIRDDGSNHTGGYVLSLLKLTGPLTSSMDSDGGPIVFEEAKAGFIDPVADQDAYVFDGIAGQRLVIQANRTSGSLNPQIHLYPPSGGPREALAGTSTWHNHSIAYLHDHVLAESGQYTILVLDDGLNHTGGYMLSVNLLP